ncbi:MAG TPA: VCBS repeat-containing protein [Planctomycetota bacterium]|nr:VCBS repeat-containing protein [Planctomycetota bacterium]
MRSPFHLAFTPAFLLALASGGTAQESKALFDAPLVMWEGDNRVEHLVDLNQDGRMDALSWWYTAKSSPVIQVRGWINNHSGTFTKAWEVFHTGPFNSFAWAHLAVGDVDGDGQLDFAVDYRRSLAVYRSNGVAPPTLLETHALSDEVADLALVDFDGDGLADLIHRTKGGLVKVHHNQGPVHGWSQLEVSSTNVGSPKSALRIAELTGDGVLDLLLVYGSEIHVLPLAADGSVGAPIVFATASTWTLPRPATGDLDGDGDLDVVVFDGSGQNGFYELLRRTGPSSWSHEAARPGGPATELADIDLDGDLDGICCGGGSGSGGTWLNAGPSTFNVCHNDGSGGFSNSFQMRGVGSSHIAGAADIDQDGDIDLIAGRAIYYARGILRASPVQEFAGPLVSVGELVDYDGDGDMDVRLSPAEVLRSDGHETLASYAPTMPAPPPGSTFYGPGYPGDFDGDGDEDLLVARFDGASFASMELLANLGGGHFVDAGPAGPPGVCFSLTGDQNLTARWSYVADLDLDGDLDLVTSGASSKAWLNDGSGFFSQAWSSTLIVMAVATLDGDAIPDAVMASFSSSQQNIYWSRGLGDGTFGSLYFFPGSYFEIKPQTDQIAVADFDGDGDLEVVGISHNTNFSGSVYYWKNTGSSNPNSLFALEYFNIGHDVSSSMLRAMAGDVNGDGWQDLITWPPLQAYGACYVLLRASDGQSFLPPFIQGLQPLAIADFDSDGDGDAIGRAWNSFDNALVFSRAIDGPQVGLRRQYGEGSAGSGGYAPLLGAVGPFRVGEPIEVRLRGGLGGASVVLAIGLNSSALPNVPYPGLTAYAWPSKRRLPMKLSGPAGMPGVGSATLSVVVPPELAGWTYFHQAFVMDPGGSNGLSCSNGLELAYD